MKELGKEIPPFSVRNESINESRRIFGNNKIPAPYRRICIQQLIWGARWVGGAPGGCARGGLESDKR